MNERGEPMTETERIARIIARKLGHNDDAGMEWERYVLAAKGVIAEPPRVSADKIAMVLAEEMWGTTGSIAFTAVRLAEMVERGEMQPV